MLHVVPRGGRADIVDSCFKKSMIWDNVRVMQLAINMRVFHTNTEAIDGLTYEEFIE